LLRTTGYTVFEDCGVAACLAIHPPLRLTTTTTAGRVPSDGRLHETAWKGASSCPPLESRSLQVPACTTAVLHVLCMTVRCFLADTSAIADKQLIF
jgi:hypothetical protein